MYGYCDYFDNKKKTLPYATYEEEIEEYYKLLDMILESCLLYKGLGKDKKLFSRGLVITEAEMEQYYSLPPHTRKTDSCDVELAASVEAAFSHIASRVKKTLDTEDKKASEEVRADMLWIETLKRVFSLDRAGVLALILALAYETDRRYARVFGFLQDDIMKTRPTIGLLSTLIARSTEGEGWEDRLKRPLEEKVLKTLFLRGDEALNLDTELVLSPFLLNLIMNAPTEEDRMPEGLTLYTEEKGIPFFFATNQKAMKLSMIPP